MLYYRQKYYIKQDFYNSYLVILVNNKKLSENILNWFCIYNLFGSNIYIYKN